MTNKPTGPSTPLKKYKVPVEYEEEERMVDEEE
jgi:hypothetical protein